MIHREKVLAAQTHVLVQWSKAQHFKRRSGALENRESITICRGGKRSKTQKPHLNVSSEIEVPESILTCTSDLKELLLEKQMCFF